MPHDESATQPARAATGQRYGKRKQQIDAQRAVPLPDNRQTPTPGPPTGGGGGGGGVAPVVDIFGPSSRPGEPVTAGAALGPGPQSPETFLPADPVERIRAAYMMFPSPGLARLLEYASRQALGTTRTPTGGGNMPQRDVV